MRVLVRVVSLWLSQRFLCPRSSERMWTLSSWFLAADSGVPAEFACSRSLVEPVRLALTDEPPMGSRGSVGTRGAPRSGCP
jgi:hypothetical protein